MKTFPSLIMNPESRGSKRSKCSDDKVHICWAM